MPLKQRLAGVLLHPTSLPGPFGIGDIGPASHHFLEWAASAGLAYWQVLPLGPTSYGDSPYQCFSANAGNPMMISPELLVREGLLTEKEILPPAFPAERVDHGWVITWKWPLLRLAQERFAKGKFPALAARYESFKANEDVAHWLDDYALFMTLKDAHDGKSWDNWETDLRDYKPAALKEAKKKHADRFESYRFAQFLFSDQWAGVRRKALSLGIEIIGDVPIYVAYDSADTWANQKFFHLDKKTALPTEVAGVPPDYFSKTGQLWGNPLYKWDVMAKDGYEWWTKRMRTVLSTVNIVRLDHFRGFMGFWSVPFGQPTAEKGKWKKGAGASFFEAMKKNLGGDLPIIAEDLGDITSDVHKVREDFGFPGMKILQFAWGVAGLDPLIPDPNSGFLPHQIDANQIVYTGSHDNDTTMGWWTAASEKERHCLRSYLCVDGKLPHWDLIRAAMRSSANTAIVPMQDFLGLGTEARMNFPGTSGTHNWSWRMDPRSLEGEIARHIRVYTFLYDRGKDLPEKAVRKPAAKPKY